jgi:putative iron-regulated protein
MKQLHFTVCISALAATLLSNVGCSDSSGPSNLGFDDRQILVDYADKVVVPTYQALNSRAAALKSAITTLRGAPTQANLDAAKAAWVATRVPWEQSEAHLFGPVAGNGYDPAMDSWPLAQNDLDAVLASNSSLTASFVKGLPEAQKGFHTIEYLLWGADSKKPASALTARELEYLDALGGDLATVTTELATSWTVGIGGAAAYRDVFATAGEGSAAYPSQQAAAEEILGGMIAIADEVANGKIAEPFAKRDPLLVESQFSFNSLLDFADNIRGIKNAYLGGSAVAGTTGRGIQQFFVGVDPALDVKFIAQVDEAVASIALIPAPFRTAITTPSAAAVIESAQQKISAVKTTLESEMMPLLGK